jgi:hypothetical protein
MVVPFAFKSPMTEHCALGFCSVTGPCNNPHCGCECHEEELEVEK